MGSRILVAYATRYGSTTGVTETLAAALADAGTVVDVLPVDEVAGFAPYDAVVIGGPIYGGEWLPEALAFVNAQREALRHMTVACFVTCLPDDDSAGTIRAKVAVIESVRAWLGPVAIGVFAGALDYGKLSMLNRLQAQTKKLREGDFRDEAAIQQWVADVLEPALTSN